jgi:hypothetical protein
MGIASTTQSIEDLMLRWIVHLLLLGVIAALVEAGIAAALDHTRTDATSSGTSYVAATNTQAGPGGDQFIPIADFPKPVYVPQPPLPDPGIWATLVATARDAYDTCARLVG